MQLFNESTQQTPTPPHLSPIRPSISERCISSQFKHEHSWESLSRLPYTSFWNCIGHTKLSETQTVRFIGCVQNKINLNYNAHLWTCGVLPTMHAHLRNGQSFPISQRVAQTDMMLWCHMMQNTESRLTPMDVPLIKLAPTRRLRLSLLATKLAIVELLWSRAHIYLLEVQQKSEFGIHS